jgi:alpha-D-ribose 1-methylphosphonate 5-triphosphate synthase subunit PhnH
MGIWVRWDCDAGHATIAQGCGSGTFAGPERNTSLCITPSKLGGGRWLAHVGCGELHDAQAVAPLFPSTANSSQNTRFVTS